MTPLERLLMEDIPAGRSRRTEPPTRHQVGELRDWPLDPDAAAHRAALAEGLDEHDRDALANAAAELALTEHHEGGQA